MSRKSPLAAGVLAAAAVCSSLALVGCAKNDGTSKSDDIRKDGMTAGTMMKSDKDIIETATGPNMERVTTLVKAIQAADLVQPLKGSGPFTVFAPTNEAFAKLPAGTLEDLLKPENKEKLRSILLYHVHAGDAIPAAKVRTMNLSTLANKPLMVTADGGSVMINNAKVIKTDVVASNGIIHWVDTVILPPM